MKTYPGIPNTPKANDTGNGWIFGKRVKGKSDATLLYLAGLQIVWVLQPKDAVTYFPTGYFSLRLAMILNACLNSLRTLTP